MKRPRILTAAIALLLVPFTAHPVTDTWDGGGADNNISTDNNWLDNTAPASDLVNTDFVFDGTVRLTPDFSAVFSARSLTFNNNAAANAFTFSGLALTVGAGGIINNDADTQTFANPVTIGAASVSFNATSGPLAFTNTVSVGSNALSLDGTGAFSFSNFSGTGTVTKTGAGTMTWSPTTVQALDLAISAGTVNTVADASADTFNASASIAVNGTSILNLNESTVLDGGQLTRSSTGTFNITFGKTITVQGGGDVTITGTFIDAGSPITVTGTGSTFTTTLNLTLRDGGDTQVLAGATLSIGVGSLIIGKGTDVVVDGGGSSLNSGSLLLGAFGIVSTLAFTNGSTGTFTNLGVARSTVAGTTGMLSVQSGASVSAGGLLVGDQQFVNTASVTITGTDSALTVTGAGMTTIGAASTSTATLTVENGGTFVTGTGLTTVNATGDLNVNAGGTMIVRGDMIVQSSLDIANGGTVILGESAPSAGAPTWPDAEDGFTAQSDDLDGDATALQTTGQVAVVPEPGICALLASAFVLTGLRPRWREARRCHRTLSEN